MEWKWQEQRLEQSHGQESVLGPDLVLPTPLQGLRDPSGNATRTGETEFKFSWKVMIQSGLSSNTDDSIWSEF